MQFFVRDHHRVVTKPSSVTLIPKDRHDLIKNPMSRPTDTMQAIARLWLVKLIFKIFARVTGHPF